MIFEKKEAEKVSERVISKEEAPTTEIREQRLWNKRYIGIAIITGLFIVLVGFAIITMFELELAYQLLTAWILTIIYAVLLFFWLEPAMLRTVQKVEVQTIERTIEKEKPVIKPYIVEKPVEKPVLIEKPVIKAFKIDRPFYLQRIGKEERKVHRYKYCASKVTKTYHTNECRLAKIMKPSHREHSDSIEIFKAKKYKKCKVCFK